MQNIPSGLISPQGSTLTIAQERAWRAFMDSGLVLTEVLNRELQDRNDLSLPQYRVLELLSESRSKSLRMSELADGVLSSRSKLTHQVGRMEQLGLVHRSSCDVDARGVVAQLTDRGERWFAAARTTYDEVVRQSFIDLLSSEQLRLLESLFDRVSNGLDRTHGETVRKLAS